MRPFEQTVILVAILGTLTCGCGKRYTIEVVPWQGRNPTSYVFACDTTRMHAVIDSVFGGHYWDAPELLARKMPGYFCSFASDSLIIVAEGKAILAKPENRRDACVKKMGYYKSFVYTHDGGQPVLYYAVHHLQVTPVDISHTRIDVKTISSFIIVGVWGWNIHGLGGAYQKSVPPSSIEEYQILRGIGRWLGVDKDIPPLQLPDQMLSTS